MHSKSLLPRRKPRLYKLPKSCHGESHAIQRTPQLAFLALDGRERLFQDRVHRFPASRSQFAWIIRHHARIEKFAYGENLKSFPCGVQWRTRGGATSAQSRPTSAHPDNKNQKQPVFLNQSR